MKHIKLIFSITVLLFATTLLFSQQEFTVSKEALGEDQTFVHIENQDGKFIEYIVDGIPDDVDASFLQDLGQDSQVAASENGSFETNIVLPSDDLGSTPLQLIEAGGKLFSFGPKSILVIDPETAEVTNTIELEGAGHYGIHTILTPHNNFLSLGDGILYCADLDGNLYYIDTETLQIIFTKTNPYGEQFSTSIVYNEEYNIVYWLINTWDDAESAIIYAMDGNTGDVLATRVYSNLEILGFDVLNNTLYISTFQKNGSGEFTKLWELDYLTLEDVNSANLPPNYSNFTIKRIFSIPGKRLLVYAKNPESDFSIFLFYDSSLQLISDDMLISTYCSDITFNDEHNKLVVATGFDSGGTALIFNKDENDNYSPGGSVTKTNINFYSVDCDPASRYAYVGGIDYLGKINLTLNPPEIAEEASIKGCTSHDLEWIGLGHDDVIYSANPVEGVYSEHNTSTCKVGAAVQTAFNSNIGCFNPINKKLYFLDEQSDYEESGIAIINAETNAVDEVLPLGKYLSDVVYDQENNKVFVSSKDDMKVYAIDGGNNEILAEISLPQEPLRLFSHGDYVYCGADNKIFVMDVNNYSYTTILLDFPNVNYEQCRGFDIDLDNNRLLALFFHESNTFIADIDLNTNQLSQLHEFDIVFGYDIVYNTIDQTVYVANAIDPTLSVFDGTTFDLVAEIPITTNSLNSVALEYDKYMNKVYMLYTVENGGSYLATVDCEENTIINTTVKNSGMDGLLHNPINDQIYYYDYLLNPDGKFETAIAAVDCLDDDGAGSNFTGNTMYYTGNDNFLDNNWNSVFKPVFNPFNNNVYFGNGAFSNISVIQAYTDHLDLKDGWNWISFPRMERNGNDYFEAIPVLERLNVFPCDLRMIYTDGYEIEYYNEFGYWNGNLNDLQTTKGYKLDIDHPSLNITLDLHGAKLDPETPMQLTAGQENWVGYFVEYPQMPKECFDGATWENLTMIKTQYWTMVKAFGVWLTDGKVTPFEYGDLVVLKVAQDQSYSWVKSGEEANESGKAITSYFSYEEQADYLPVYVEFDPVSEVQEVAVTVDGEVKGAAVRETGDTIVEVNAYLGGLPPDAPLEFETWDGYKSAPVEKDGYIVYDQTTQQREKRMVYAGEPAQYQLVSFKTSEVYTLPGSISDISFRPNPLTDKATITFRLNKAMHVDVGIYDINGRKVKGLMGGDMPGGYYTTDWDATNESGAKVKKGIYFYRLRTSDGTMATDKIVVL